MSGLPATSIRGWLLVASILVGAAALEVLGDAIIRSGLRGRGGWWVSAGALTLAAYGVVVNLVPGDFSRLLGGYVAVFALVAVLVGRYGFGETIAATTWLGLILVILGGALMQVGSR